MQGVSHEMHLATYSAELEHFIYKNSGLNKQMLLFFSPVKLT